MSIHENDETLYHGTDLLERKTLGLIHRFRKHYNEQKNTVTPFENAARSYYLGPPSHLNTTLPLRALCLVNISPAHITVLPWECEPFEVHRTAEIQSDGVSLKVVPYLPKRDVPWRKTSFTEW
jgi:hypothetical protein